MKIIRDYNETDDTLFIEYYEESTKLLYLYDDDSGMFGILPTKEYDEDYPFKESICEIGDIYSIMGEVPLENKETMQEFVEKIFE